MVIAIVIASYYIMEKITRSKFQANFTIETVSGNKDVLKDVVMEGVIHDQKLFYQEFYMTDTETKYLGNNDSDMQLFYHGAQNKYKDYFKKYRSFMRSKLYTDFKLIDRGDDIITAHIEEEYHKQSFNLKKAELQIEILNKDNNEEKKFTIPLSIQGFDSYHVSQLYEEDNSLSVLLNAYSNEHKELFSIHQIDLNSGEAEAVDLIEFELEDVDYFKSRPLKQLGGARYAFFDTAEVNGGNREFTLYDLKTNKQLDVKADLMNGIEFGTMSVYVKEDFLYYMEYDKEEDQSFLKKYDIAKQNIVKEIDISDLHQPEFVGPEAIQFKYEKGKIIIYNWNASVKEAQDLKNMMLKVIDEKTFETEFIGHLKSADLKNIQRPLDIYLD